MLYLNKVYLEIHVCETHVPSPGLMNVRALAGGTGWSRLGERARVQDPLGSSVHRRLRRNRMG